MAQRRRFSAEYKREAMAMLDTPGASVSQIAAELGIGAACSGAGGASCVRNQRRRFLATVDPARRRWSTSVGS